MNPTCGQCGGPHPFDTTVPSVQWNRVIRTRELSDYLCLTCIARAFVEAGESFTAELNGMIFTGVPTIEVVVNGRASQDATRIQAENNALRAQLATATAALETVRRQAAAVVAHWDEFGPEFEFNVPMDFLRAALAQTGAPTAPTDGAS